MNISNLIQNNYDSIKQKKNFYNHQNLLIVGANTSGKSKYIKDFIKKINLSECNYYFIDTTNRTIPLGLNQERNNTFYDLDISDIRNERNKNNNFNKKDIFTSIYGPEILENSLIQNLEYYSNLFKVVLEITLSQDVSSNSNPGIVNDLTNEISSLKINNHNLDQVSNGIQAQLRMLMEIDFAIKNHIDDRPFIIFIDEVNISLDSVNSWKFIQRIMERYANIRFIFTSLSAYTALGLDNVDIIKLDKDPHFYQIFDSCDLDSIDFIDRTIFSFEEKVNQIDICISNAIKKKTLNVDFSDEIETLDSFYDKFSIKQKLAYKFLKDR